MSALPPSPNRLGLSFAYARKGIVHIHDFARLILRNSAASGASHFGCPSMSRPIQKL